ncbi:MAG: alcohol dehydrogenase [Acidobacteriales bacterium 59-55]|nr:aldo/keto reductase [Terriglobales bacterium]OJV43753.1 MAG: alcohol dehydrogenase [Acidobacteriales bacterium 59-55]
MQTKTLGHSNIQVAPLVFGGNVFGWTVDAEKSFSLLDAFADRGFNCIDTADTYSRWVPGNKGGESEAILGQWFKRSGKRDQIVLATKVGVDMGDGKKGLGRRYILEEAEASLRRLQTDHIDLYQTHKDDETVPLEERFEAYRQLIQQGKVRIIGASKYNGARLTEAIETAQQHGLPVYQTLQPEYNLHARQAYETDLAPVAEKFGLSVIPFFSLASGFLTGKYKSKAESIGTSRERMLAKYFDERGERILKALDEVSQQLNARPASIALAWLLAQPTVTAPIASATSMDQIESLFAAVDLKLDQAALDKLNQASTY